VLYYGLLHERRSLAQIFAADFSNPAAAPASGAPAAVPMKQPAP
jgi:hypothetical protein